jgi:HD-GYP domain-containing protein (c-di-GMP phosphodiesterase class II)
LSHEERFKINEHTLSGLEMLNQIPFTRSLDQVTEIAVGHHETLIGTGYPLKKTKADLMVETRILTIADIFEALTACDRPYKRAKTLSEALKIMNYMCKYKHIDADIFNIFLLSGIYKKYAEKYLSSDQCDVDDIQGFLSVN